MELGAVSARELGCSGSRAGCSDAKPIARGTRATTEERNRFYAIDNCVCRSPCRGSRAGCINENGDWKPPVLVRRRHACHYSVVPPTSYGDLFGEAVAEAAAEVAAAAPGDGALASPGFTLINSTSKMSIAFGPISPPVPLGP